MLSELGNDIENHVKLISYGYSTQQVLYRIKGHTMENVYVKLRQQPQHIYRKKYVEIKPMCLNMWYNDVNKEWAG